ncbi:MAG: DUF1924 domain-containing protein [Ghiorsea sp.]
MKKMMIMVALLALTPALAQANAIPEMMDKYKAAGASNFSAEAGKKMWTKEMPYTSKKGEHITGRSCSTCHNAVPTTPGKHAKTGKVIPPMTQATQVENRRSGEMKPRFSSAKKIKKWFKRNCKWTYGRVCTAQEKGNFLMFFKSL